MDPDSTAREPGRDVTRLLGLACRGDVPASEELYACIYGELHRIAEAHMRREEPGQTLQPTALVNEAWLRLVRSGPTDEGYRDREHFLSVASRAMRSALVDQARRRNAQKRGGGRSRVPLDVALDVIEERGVDVLSLHEALERLSQDEPRQSRIVELRFFGGLALAEIARNLQVSLATVNRDLRMARIWLREELRMESA